MQLKNLIVQSVFWRGLYFLTVLLLNVLVARLFKASGSGWIYYISSFYAFVIVIISLSLESGLGFFASKNELPAGKLLFLAVAWTLVVGLMVLLANFFLLPATSKIPMSARLLTVSSISYICGNLLTNYCSSIFYAKRNFQVPNVIGIACNLLLITILAALINGRLSWLDTDRFLYVYFLTFIFQGLAMVAAILWLYTKRNTDWVLSMQQFRQLLRYSLVAFIANIIFFLVYRVDYFFVRHYCTAVDLGNYIQVSKLGQMVILIPSIMASAVFPMVAGGQREEVNRGLQLLSRISLLTIGIFCLLIILTGTQVFSFVFGKSFDRMYWPFLLLVPGILSLTSLYPLTAYYSGKNRLGVNVTGSAIALCFIVVADFIFIPVYGINAAALVSSLGYMLYHVYVLAIFSKEYHTSVSGFFILKKTDITWIKQFVSKPFVECMYEDKQ